MRNREWMGEQLVGYRESSKDQCLINFKTTHWRDWLWLKKTLELEIWSKYGDVGLKLEKEHRKGPWRPFPSTKDIMKESLNLTISHCIEMGPQKPWM